MHRLQTLFADAAAEKKFEQKLRELFETGRYDLAEEMLAAELEGLDAPIAEICRATSREHVVVSGWDELADAASAHEGDPVTAALVVFANREDLAFEKGQTHDPVVSAGLFTDEVGPFSESSDAELIAACRDPEAGEWMNDGEDVEVYLEIEGLAELNTALLFHKQRHFFRDDKPEQAPLRYVDFVIGCWWRALRCQQAIIAANEQHPLPGGVRAISCVVGMRPETVCVHGSAGGAAGEAEKAGPTPVMGALDAPTLVQRQVVEEVEEMTGASLRRRFASSEPEEVEEEQAGLFRRILGWRKAA